MQAHGHPEREPSTARRRPARRRVFRRADGTVMIKDFDGRLRRATTADVDGDGRSRSPRSTC
jgi:hypothetical protein